MSKYTHKQPTDFEREYILGPDGVFYSREVITTPVVGQADLINRCKVAPTLNIFPVINNIDLLDSDEQSQIKQRFVLGYYEGTYSNDAASNLKYIYVKLSAFPFPKANLVKQFNENAEFTERCSLHPSRISSNLPNVIPYTNTLSYFSRMHDLYITFSLSQGTYYKSHKNSYAVSVPYLFGVHKTTKEPVCINLPNVFETGKICTGDDYGDVGECYTVYDAVRKVITDLCSSPANHDLFPSNEQVLKYLSYRESGALIHSEEGNDYVTKPSGFFTPITKSTILQFCESPVIQKEL